MNEVFQNYEHYANWIFQNFKKGNGNLDDKIIEGGLIIEIGHHGEKDFRLMFESEFNEKERIKWIEVPTP